MKRRPRSGTKFPNDPNKLRARSSLPIRISLACTGLLLLLPQILQGQEAAGGAIVPNAGFGLVSLGRGALGMAVLLLLAYLFSTNRKRINWKTTGIGLGLQLLLAIGVLKVPAVQWVFNQLGRFFNGILEFTAAGSTFLFGNLMDLENANIGYVFAFQILPTIIFFSALTSVLYYLGVIQRIVRGLAWLLTRSLGISGPESLSVAGNIFLGQTEAPLLIKAYLEKMNRSEILLLTFTLTQDARPGAYWPPTSVFWAEAMRPCAWNSPATLSPLP